GEAGQLGLEVDGARAFLAGEGLLAERDQLARERRPRLDAGDGLHDGLDLPPKIGVRAAGDGPVRHLRVRARQGLALLGVDVDAAGDDHEGRPVGEVEESVLDIADVSDRAHGGVGRARLRRLDRIVEVLEGGRRLEPYCAGYAGRAGAHLLVADVQV